MIWGLLTSRPHAPITNPCIQQLRKLHARNTNLILMLEAKQINIVFISWCMTEVLMQFILCVSKTCYFYFVCFFIYAKYTLSSWCIRWFFPSCKNKEKEQKALRKLLPSSIMVASALQGSVPPDTDPFSGLWKFGTFWHVFKLITA